MRHGDVTTRDGTATMRRKISKIHEYWIEIFCRVQKKIFLKENKTKKRLQNQLWKCGIWHFIAIFDGHHQQQHLIFTYIDSRLKMTTKNKIGHERFECAVSTYTQQIQRTTYLNWIAANKIKSNLIFVLFQNIRIYFVMDLVIYFRKRKRNKKK